MTCLYISHFCMNPVCLRKRNGPRSAIYAGIVGATLLSILVRGFGFSRFRGIDCGKDSSCVTTGIGGEVIHKMLDYLVALG